MKRGLTWISLIVLAWAGSEAQAGDISFIADAVQSHPQHGVEHGRMYVSPEGMRMESMSQGQQTIQISMPAKGLMRILFPQHQTYMEMQVEPGPGTGGSKPENPCFGLGEDRCRKLGEEKIGGMDTEKWRIEAENSPDNPQGAIMVWWEPVRHVSLRQEFPDGSVSQMSFLGEATHEDRKVERWEMLMISAKGEQQRAQQLLDRELGVAVREEFPSGVVRELRNIRLVQPDPSWFAVPQGYRLQQQQPRGGGK